MGKKTVSYSDLSGQVLSDEDQPVRLVVLEHPDLGGGPVALEALPREVAPAVDAGLTVAIFELLVPGDEPCRVVVDADDFDALATDRPMRELLKTAEPFKPASTGTNYATLEHAGTPHRGKVTAKEAQIVREHLAAVNARLAAEGLRQIDPANPADAEKYGITPPVQESADLGR